MQFIERFEHSSYTSTINNVNIGFINNGLMLTVALCVSESDRYTILISDIVYTVALNTFNDHQNRSQERCIVMENVIHIAARYDTNSYP